jgi:hypothetical protein
VDHKRQTVHADGSDLFGFTEEADDEERGRLNLKRIG